MLVELVVLGLGGTRQHAPATLVSKTLDLIILKEKLLTRPGFMFPPMEPPLSGPLFVILLKVALVDLDIIQYVNNKIDIEI